MATWVLRQAPWYRIRFRLGYRVDAVTFKQYFSTPPLSEEPPSMAEMKRQPYPSVPLDSSIFEDVSEDYGLCASPSSVSHTHMTPTNPSELLANLVRNGKFSDADRVLTELMAMGITVQLSSVYQSAAIHVLDTCQDPAERRLRFVRWWSLMPDMTSGDHRATARVEAILFKQQVPDLPLITQYALINASKGYATVTSLPAISDMIRYASPSISKSFLDAFDKAARQSLENQLVSASETRGQYLTDSLALRREDWYSCAVKGHCMARRLDEAVKTLQMARAENISIHGSAYDALLRTLEKTLDVRNISVVEELRRADSRAQEHDILRPDTATKFTPDYQPPSELHASVSFKDRQSLAGAIRVLRRSMFPSGYPLPSALATFIHAYKSIGHSIALRVLRGRSYRTYPTTSMWALAEMLYHFRKLEGHLVLVVFAHHFHLVGVPERTGRYLRRTQNVLEQEGATSVQARSLVLFPQEPLKEKLWPSTHHTALVWRVISQNVISAQGLEELYQELLAQVAQARNPDQAVQHVPLLPSGTDSPDVSYPAPIAPPSQYDSAHFNVFIYAFAKLAGPSRAAQVIVDMYRFGITPSVESLTMLTAAFARVGDVNKLIMLLDRMEKTPDPSSSPTVALQVDRSEDQAATTAAPPTSTFSKAKPSSKLPLPNVVTYTAVMKYLMEAGRHEDALIVCQRMEKHIRYTPGSHPPADAVLNDLALYYSRSTVPQEEP